MTTPRGGIMRSKSIRPNLSTEQRAQLDRLVGRLQGIEPDLETVAQDTAGLVTGSIGGGTTRDEAYWLARAARSGAEAESASRQTEFALHMANAGAPMGRPNPAIPRSPRPNLTAAEVDVLVPALRSWAQAESLEAKAKTSLEQLVTPGQKEAAERRRLARLGIVPDPDELRIMRNMERAEKRRAAKQPRPNVTDSEGAEIADVLRGWLDAERQESQARDKLIGMLPREYDPEVFRANPAADAAHRLDAEFSAATPHERAAVKRTLRVLSETVARDNPIGVTALALALPNPAGPHAVPYLGSHDMAQTTYKNPARVLAGKMAWAAKSAHEKAQSLANLHGGARDNISRPRWEILSSMGMTKVGGPEQFGGVPPFLTKKQAEAFQEAVAWRLMPVKPPKTSRKKKEAKPLTDAEKAKRAERAQKREDNLGKSLQRLEKQLAAGGVSGEALQQAVAALKKSKEEAIQAYKQGVRLGQSSSLYARSPAAYAEDATVQGYLARVEELLKKKQEKKKASTPGGKGLGLWSAAAKRKDPAAWAKVKAEYDANIKGADAATKKTAQELAISEYQAIAAKQNPGGISGFKGWAKTVGYGLGGFVGGSALSNLIDRVTNGSMSTITRFGVPLALGAAVWHFGKSWSPELRYGLIGGLVASALFRPLLLGLLSKIPIIGGMFASIAGGAEAAPAGTSGIGDLYDEAFGVQGYVLGDDDDDDGLDGYVLGDDDDDDGLDGYVLGDDGTGAYVLSGEEDEDDGGMDGFEEAVAGDVNDGEYDWSDGEGTSGFEEAVAGVGNFEEAVAGDDDDGGEVEEDLEEAEAMQGLGDAEVRRQIGGWERLAAKYGKSVAYLKANYKVLTMTPNSARNVVQAGRGKVIGRSKRHAGMMLVLFRMTRIGQPRGPIERGAQVVRQITARRPEELAIRRPMGGAVAPGGIFQTSIFGTRPQYTQQRGN